MRLLVTADWQAQWQNLTRCQQAATRVLDLVEKHTLEAVAFAGDLKHQYNPVDLRVIHFWTDFLKDLKKAGALPVVLLGNHDRAGLYADNVSWLPILEDAGAFVCSKAHRLSLIGGASLHLLPFCSPKELPNQIKALNAYPADPEQDVLLFHQTLTGAQWNHYASVEPQDGGLDLKALRPNRYKFCLGGDIHLPQKVGPNCWYVGSPFPMDWGEVNQRKLFALVIQGSLTWRLTGLPSWYDPDGKGFQAPKDGNYQDCRVRINVPLGPGKAYHTQLEKAKAQATRDFPGADLTVNLKVQTQDGPDTQAPDIDQTEAQQIEQYINQWAPKDDAPALLSYVNHLLNTVPDAVRSAGQVRFSKVAASNFLSFKKMELDLDTPGLALVTGINHDRPGKSNGAGKSSLLSALPVALFGKTFKDQKADEWANNRTDKTAAVSARFTLPTGDNVTAIRTRRPVAVRMEINGQDVSAGGKSTDVGRDIQNIVGYSWTAFASTVYISQEETHAFLWGTPVQRQQMIARLQNLERFEAALKMVRRSRAALQILIRDTQEELDKAADKFDTLQQAGDPSAELEAATQRFNKATALVHTLQTQKPTAPDRTQLDRVNTQLDQADNLLWDLNATRSSLVGDLDTLADPPEVCPTCNQPWPDDRQHRAALKTRRQQLQLKIKAQDVKIKKQKRIRAQADQEHTRLQEAHTQQSQHLARHQVKLDNAVSEEWNANQNLEHWQQKQKDHHRDLQQARRLQNIQQAAVDDIQLDDQFLAMAENILSRDALPAYLSALMIPPLNRAAHYYSRLFTQSEIQVQFSIQKGQVHVELINPYGGSTIKDQSTGERRIAALITSFALRDAAPTKANLLILDEPGDGLDNESARTFAAGLKKLRRFGSIFVVTHDNNMAAELSDKRHIVIEKRKGISAII